VITEGAYNVRHLLINLKEHSNLATEGDKFSIVGVWNAIVDSGADGQELGA